MTLAFILTVLVALFIWILVPLLDEAQKIEGEDE
jgi:hypothetical protein